MKTKLIKNLIALSALIVCVPALAGTSELQFRADAVLDLQATNGDVVTVNDIRDGYAEVKNVTVENDVLKIHTMDGRSPVQNLQMFDGSRLNIPGMFQLCRGGDGGGGGKVN